jgi:DNA polymerase III gamma/tau subunit
MTKPLIQIGNEIREMTKAEHNQHLLDLAEWQAQKDAQAAKAAARQAVLEEKLGLTQDEAQALLG